MHVYTFASIYDHYQKLAADVAEKDSVINMQKLELDNLKKDHKHLVTMHRDLKDKRRGNSVAVQTEKVYR